MFEIFSLIFFACSLMIFLAFAYTVPKPLGTMMIKVFNTIKFLFVNIYISWNGLRKPFETVLKPTRIRRVSGTNIYVLAGPADVLPPSVGDEIVVVMEGELRVLQVALPTLV